MSRSGAHILLSAAKAAGIRICFANPGTTELDIVRALQDVPEIRSILCLFEGVCTGAADGYARVSGMPALTLLHLGPGFANGIANLHNARRARSRVINLVGDHATWHLEYDAPLTSDIASLAQPVGAVINIANSIEIGAKFDEAQQLASGHPGSVVTLITPSDIMEEAVVAEIQSASPPSRPVQRAVAPDHISTVANLIRGQARPLVLLLGGDTLTEKGIMAAGRIAHATGARLLMEPYPAIVPLGGGLPRVERLAYFPQDVIHQLGDALVLLAGALRPVSYFGYQGQPSVLVPDERLVSLCVPGDDGADALEQLELLLDGYRAGAQPRAEPVLVQRTNALTPEGIAEELVDQVPDGAIISLEGSTLGGAYLKQAHRVRRHRVMTNTGGAIGQGLPCAVGAALASPDARVISLQSDGSAQYTLQSLWTMAREQLNITIILAANNRYGILQTELTRSGVELTQNTIHKLTALDAPCIDWVALATGYGVRAVRVTSAAEFSDAFREALTVSGPMLIEGVLP